jgi:hypothetical protein
MRSLRPEVSTRRGSADDGWGVISKPESNRPKNIGKDQSAKAGGPPPVVLHALLQQREPLIRLCKVPRADPIPKNYPVFTTMACTARRWTTSPRRIYNLQRQAPARWEEESRHSHIAYWSLRLRAGRYSMRSRTQSPRSRVGYRCRLTETRSGAPGPWSAEWLFSNCRKQYPMAVSSPG